MSFVPTLAPEELARANFYALLARLLYAPPDEALLRTLAAAEDIDAEAGAIGAAWQALSAAAAATGVEAAREEYDTVFVGTGKAPITLYACAYSIRYSNEVPLVDLRAHLAALGLGRNEQAMEPEDHVAALCDVMRHLVMGKPQDLEAQKEFFEKWIWPIVQPLCGAIEKSDRLVFYKSVGRLFREVCALEHEAFEML